MLKMKTNTLYVKHLLLLCLTLFSLSPCSVKEIWSVSIAAENPKPFNKSRSTTPLYGCTYVKIENNRLGQAKKINQKLKIEPSSILFHTYCYPCLAHSYSCFSKNYSGNSPPKYILFKRLKIDIA